MKKNIKLCVAIGIEIQEIFKLAREKHFALPTINVINSNSINDFLETAKELNAPTIIPFSNGDVQFSAGKGLLNKNEKAGFPLPNKS